MADLGNVRQGLEAFFTNTPVTQIRDRDRTSAKNRLDEMLALDEQRQKAMAIDARGVNTALKNRNTPLARRLINNRLADLGRLGGDPTETQNILDGINSGDIEGTIKELDDFDRVAVSLKLVDDPIDREIKEAKLQASLNPAKTQQKSLDQKKFEDLMDLAGLSKAEKKEAARIKLRLIPGAVGSSAQTISADQQLTDDVATSQAAIEAAKEIAKLKSQLRLKPAIQKAVTLATGEANLISDNKELANSNEKALKVYSVGIESLAGSLSNTTTGPFAGLMPALTSSAQSAEGAIAIMAPLLKKVFRASGEGNFTDSDQKLLMDMIPTRSDRPSAVKFKLNAIDAIIQAKLGVQQGQQSTDSNSTAEQPQPSAENDNELTSPSGIKFTVSN